MRSRRDRRAEGWFWRYRSLALVSDLLLTLYPASAYLYALYGKRGLFLSPLLVAISFAIGGAVRFLFCEKEEFCAYGRNFLPDSAPLFDCELHFLARVLSIALAAALAFPIAALFALDSSLTLFLALILGVIGWLGGEHIGRTVTGCLSSEHLLTVFFVFCLTSALTPLVVDSVGMAILLMVLSLVAALLCYGTLVVQVGILRLATTRTTCHLTRPMLRSGTRQAVSLVLLIPTLAAMLFTLVSALITLLRLPIVLIAAIVSKTSDDALFRALFAMPTTSASLNAVLTLIGLAMIAPGVMLLRRMRSPAKRERLFTMLFASRERRSGGAEAGETVERHLAYTDVIRGAVGDAPTLPADYAELERRLAACSSERERIGLAYRMMVACLVSRNLGVSLSDTPREIASALVSRGIGSDADALSSAFEAAVYAPPSDQAGAPSLAPLLSRILSIIRVYLP